MKIQLDFSAKTIKVEAQVNFCELHKKLKSILPDLKEWTIDCNSPIVWNTYTVWDWHRPYVYLGQPLYTTGSINAGVVNDNPILTTTCSDTVNHFAGNVQDCNVVNLQLN